ncbi:MAG TPA: DUF5681 domain-containing protein [Rhizomicrobium sp.]|jgi:hypothetical protein
MANTKFKPGKSGNPKGRPKGSRNLATLFRAELSALVDGDEGKASKLEAMIKAQVDQAAKGDPRATQATIKQVEKIEAFIEAARKGVSFTSADRETIEEIHRRLTRCVSPSDAPPPEAP